MHGSRPPNNSGARGPLLIYKEGIREGTAAIATRSVKFADIGGFFLIDGGMLIASREAFLALEEERWTRTH